jgi:hypothetical protein
MVATCQQIVTRALQIAKAPNYTSQAGQTLNDILSDLAQTYDFDAARVTFNFNFDLSLGSGPFPLPSDYLRAENEDVFYTFDGVKYVMINVDLAEFDSMIQQPGLNNFPTYYTTDLSLSPPGLYVWMPPLIAFPVTIRYRSQMADIPTPETSSVVPWFLNSVYLVTRLAGEMCKITGDDRWQALLGDGPHGAEGILRKYLQSEGDRTARSRTVKLDRRRFGANKWNSLPTSKLTGY